MLSISLHCRVILAMRRLDSFWMCVDDSRSSICCRTLGWDRSIGRLLNTFQASIGTADQTQSTKLTVSLSGASFPNTMLWDT